MNERITPTVQRRAPTRWIPWPTATDRSLMYTAGENAMIFLTLNDPSPVNSNSIVTVTLFERGQRSFPVVYPEVEALDSKLAEDLLPQFVQLDGAVVALRDNAMRANRPKPSLK